MNRVDLHLRPFDVLTLGYLTVVAALVTIFHSKVHNWYAYPLAFAVGAVLVCVLAATYHRRPDVRVLAFFRWSYPLFFSLVLYPAIGPYVLILRGHFLDGGMNAWEQRAFGGHPNLVLDRIASPPLTEVLYACYFGFYLFFLVPPLALFVRRRYADLERYVFTLMAALYVCYLGFLVVPLAGPGASLAGQFHPATLTGYVIVPVQKFIMANGDPAGACFPSAHVAGAWAAMLAIRRVFGRRVFWIVFPIAVGLTVAVVYTRYHYLSDALAGLVVAVVVFSLVQARNWRMVEPPAPMSPAVDAAAAAG
ncbi:MAG TPA: phosphatase PAP2 family protein [Micromonosporaceae bacterium]|jgi:membrane-associated phospholipid phosphatase